MTTESANEVELQRQFEVARGAFTDISLALTDHRLTWRNGFVSGGANTGMVQHADRPGDDQHGLLWCALDKTPGVEDEQSPGTTILDKLRTVLL